MMLAKTLYYASCPPQAEKMKTSVIAAVLRGIRVLVTPGPHLKCRFPNFLKPETVEMGTQQFVFYQALQLILKHANV